MKKLMWNSAQLRAILAQFKEPYDLGEIIWDWELGRDYFPEDKEYLFA